MNNGVNNFLDATGKVLEVAPKLYDDLLQPTVKETGKALSLIPKSVNAVLSPIRQWIANKEFNIAETEKLLAYKLENISPDKIVQPESYVAVPALQAISYSMDNKELRELYANLLAKSMNVDTKDSVHPAFVEIIKQLSPSDAILLKKLSDTEDLSFAIIKLRLEKSSSNNEGIDWIHHIINNNFGIDVSNYNQYAVSLENLQRLQLISIDYSNSLADEYDYEYKEIENNEIVNHFKKISYYINEKYSFFRCKRGILKITNLGKEFISICVN
ncbi:DUF4393 domain-containing protein [Clostridium perfringens]|uniref:DUF4393 domain-containing protein n=1 Tax=Clostridium perfringens TaxID=1502 RepID=UPI001CCCDE3F|nr:DUF4393 domain-containing protein [Clostridium perfringens]MDM0471346.1 DUF4393 domain-containing protein [Clostridium perfringens]MDM0479517.1 DUF4393 domain-containing protein [Clostridium perfringens]MDM0496242.1 DUF4393 domain-containing protein [Clostridium perfringens]UBK87733.1 DUF4393 domain-containing protein [Clostridium perfringens]